MSTANARPAQDWRWLVAVFFAAQLVETVGVSQVFALLPSYLLQLGVPETERLAFVGLYGSLMFVLGLPLVPLWGVWADKFSRKVVIVRSSLVMTAVLAVAALANEPWQLAIAVMLIGLQLGNTGVMLAGIRDVTPRGRLGVTIALFGAAGPIGFAVGPILAGLLIDGLGWSIAGVYAASSALALGIALVVALGTVEIRPEVVPAGSTLRLARSAIANVLADPGVRRLFAVYGIVFLANQVSRPYTPVLVEGITGTGPGLASGIGLVMGVGALVGALSSPAAGYLGDRVGFRPVLVAALATGGLASLAMPAAPGLWLLAGASVLLGAAVATTGAMVMSLLATEVPAERRSATLNLVYLPLYVAGIVGPAIGGGIATLAGPAGPFVAGGIVFLGGAAAVALAGRRGRVESGVPESPPLR